MEVWCLWFGVRVGWRTKDLIRAFRFKIQQTRGGGGGANEVVSALLALK